MEVQCGCGCGCGCGRPLGACSSARGRQLLPPTGADHRSSTASLLPVGGGGGLGQSARLLPVPFTPAQNEELYPCPVAGCNFTGPTIADHVRKVHRDIVYHFTGPEEWFLVKREKKEYVLLYNQHVVLLTVCPPDDSLQLVAVGPQEADLWCTMIITPTKEQPCDRKGLLLTRECKLPWTPIWESPSQPEPQLPAPKQFWGEDGELTLTINFAPFPADS